MVTARTWCRVDFAGGTLDIWPLGLLHPGAVTVNLAIDVATRVALGPSKSGYRLSNEGREWRAAELSEWFGDPATALVGHLGSCLELGAVDIEVESGSPRGGGLGASSALAVAFIVAAEAYSGAPERSLEARCRLARDVEARLMGLPTGLQDHIPALRGGLLAIEHAPGGETVESMEVDWEELGESLVVAYTGQSHFSAGNNWRIVRRRLDGNPDAIRRFGAIAATGVEMAEAFRQGNFERAGALMSQEWAERRELADGISTERIEAILATALENGAWGGKACGAGGGGCVAILAPPARRSRVVGALAGVAEILPARPCPRPFELRME